MIYTANKHWRYQLFVNGRQLFGAYYVNTANREVRLFKMEDNWAKGSPVVMRKDKRTGLTRGPVRQTWHLPRGSIKMVKS